VEALGGVKARGSISATEIAQALVAIVVSSEESTPLLHWNYCTFTLRVCMFRACEDFFAYVSNAIVAGNWQLL